MLFLRSKKEIVQKLRNPHLLPVAQIDIFCDILNHIDHLHLLVKLEAVLAVITEPDRFAHVKATAVRLHFTHQHLDKSRFSRSVIPDNSHLFVTGEYIVEIFHNLQFAKTFRDMLRLENLRPDIRSLDIQVDIPSLMLKFGLLLQLIESVDPVFSLCPACLRLTAHPVELFAKQVACPIHLGIQRIHALLPFFQIITVISLILVNLLPVYLDNLATDTIQEITVVRHH